MNILRRPYIQYPSMNEFMAIETIRHMNMQLIQCLLNYFRFAIMNLITQIIPLGLKLQKKALIKYLIQLKIFINAQMTYIILFSFILHGKLSNYLAFHLFEI
ncbi:unnamed protein product [Paramecium pentaurelia]|uniref:Transmembrane protein n=1 Tax=Paramecium pentaurelia TaxID=43138 RepID=A0A8S1V1T1_9CILI|nr:unnamed protein product [Paramecium pentaurelia]